MIERIAAFVAVALLAAACTAPEVAPRASTPAPAAASAPAPVAPPSPPPPPPPPPVTAQSELGAGVKSYEDGDYKEAARQLQSALDMGLVNPVDRARAHKYRAFMVCVNGREKVCRDEFRLAIEADPTFALAPAEAGHPVWSQVVKTVKAEMAKNKTKK